MTGDLTSPGQNAGRWIEIHYYARPNPVVHGTANGKVTYTFIRSGLLLQ